MLTLERLFFGLANLRALGTRRIADVPYARGRRRSLDLYPTDVRRGGPLVVFFYGGSFAAGSKFDYRFVGAAFAAAGYVTALPDYRVLPEARFPEFVHDAALAVTGAQRHALRLGADPRRIVVAGHSAGAYLAALLAYEPRYLEAAGGSPASVTGFVGLSGPYDLAPDAGRVAPGVDLAALGEQRPVARVRRGAPPALLIHGGADELISPQHSRRLAAALRAVGTRAELRVIPGRRHADTVAALSLPENGDGPFATIRAFLDRLERGRPVRHAARARRGGVRTGR